jgi:hypothetical protein
LESLSSQILPLKRAKTWNQTTKRVTPKKKLNTKENGTQTKRAHGKIATNTFSVEMHWAHTWMTVHKALNSKTNCSKQFIWRTWRREDGFAIGLGVRVKMEQVMDNDMLSFLIFEHIRSQNHTNVSLVVQDLEEATVWANTRPVVDHNQPELLRQRRRLSRKSLVQLKLK